MMVCARGSESFLLTGAHKRIRTAGFFRARDGVKGELISIRNVVMN